MSAPVKPVKKPSDEVEVRALADKLLEKANAIIDPDKKYLLAAVTHAVSDVCETICNQIKK